MTSGDSHVGHLGLGDGVAVLGGDLTVEGAMIGEGRLWGRA